MERFIIDPTSISPEEIKANLMTYIESKPEALRWKGFYDSSAGQIIVDFIVGFVSFFIYHITVARREAYLTHAENRSSHLAIAQNLSYSVFRGRNARIRYQFQATSEPILFAKWQSIGSIGEEEILVLEDTIINTGETGFVTCIVGSVFEEVIQVDSSLIKPFRFISTAVSEDVRLYQNDTELEFSKQLKDLANGKHALISNAFGAVDLYYLNNVAPLYATGDEFKIEFIRLSNIEINLDEVTLTEIGGSNGELVSTYLEPEQNEAVKVNAPLYFETQYSIRGRNDFKKIFKTLDSRLVDTNGEDYSASVVELTYLKSDLSALTQVEKDGFISTLSTDLPYGTIAPRIRDPFRTELAITVVIKLNRIITENLPLIVAGILAPYENKLMTSIDLEDVETTLSKLEYVKNARVTTSITVRGNSTFYKRLDFTAESLSCAEPKFEFYKHIRKSGSSEPVWPVTDGERIQDGRIIWEARDERTCNLDDWFQDTNYEIGNKIKPLNGPSTLIFVCVATENLSGAIEPVWNEDMGAITNDEELIWQTVELVGSPDTWLAGTSYEVGDIVVQTGTPDVAYQVVAFRSKSGATEPVFPIAPNLTFEDGDIQWISRDISRSLVTSRWNEHIVTKPTVTIANG